MKNLFKKFIFLLIFLQFELVFCPDEETIDPQNNEQSERARVNNFKEMSWREKLNNVELFRNKKREVLGSDEVSAKSVSASEAFRSLWSRKGEDVRPDQIALDRVKENNRTYTGLDANWDQSLLKELASGNDKNPIVAKDSSVVKLSTKQNEASKSVEKTDDQLPKNLKSTFKSLAKPKEVENPQQEMKNKSSAEVAKIITDLHDQLLSKREKDPKIVDAINKDAALTDPEKTEKLKALWDKFAALKKQFLDTLQNLTPDQINGDEFLNLMINDKGYKKNGETVGIMFDAKVVAIIAPKLSQLKVTELLNSYLQSDGETRLKVLLEHMKPGHPIQYSERQLGVIKKAIEDVQKKLKDNGQNDEISSFRDTMKKKFSI